MTEIAQALLAARTVLHKEFQGFERRVRALARRDDRAKLLMSAPGVGVLVAPTCFDRLKRSGSSIAEP